MPAAAVIFDLDGVIVDSEIWWHQERVAWAAERGLRWTEPDTRAVMGANSRRWARIMRERLGLPEADEPAILEAVVWRVIDRYKRGAPIIDGAVDAVRRIAAGWPVAVASSAHRSIIDAALDSIGLRDEITIAVSSDEVSNGKPEPGCLPGGRPPPGRAARRLPRRRGFGQRRLGRRCRRDDGHPRPERQRASGAWGGSRRPSCPAQPARARSRDDPASGRRRHDGPGPSPARGPPALEPDVALLRVPTRRGPGRCDCCSGSAWRDVSTCRRGPPCTASTIRAGRTRSCSTRHSRSGRDSTSSGRRRRIFGWGRGTV